MSEHKFQFGMHDEVIVTINGIDIYGGYIAAQSVNGECEEWYHIRFDEADQMLSDVEAARIRPASDTYVDQHDRLRTYQDLHDRLYSRMIAYLDGNPRVTRDELIDLRIKLCHAKTERYAPNQPKEDDENA